MKQQIKKWIKKGLSDRQCRQYDRTLEKKTVTYDAWIRDAERVWTESEIQSVEKASLQVRYIPYEACKDYVMGTALQSELAHVVVFADDNGKVSDIAQSVVADFFGSHWDIDMAYGDEDVMSPEGIRYTPWLKPDWSPDTFLSYFYFGSIFAVRTRALQALTKEELHWIWDGEGLYRLCYVLAVKSGGFLQRKDNFPIGHMDEILFHSNRNREMALAGSRKLDRNGCPLTEAGSLRTKKMQDADLKSGTVRIPQQRQSGKVALSVIIPSKDNPEILKQCIRSFQKNVSGTGKEADASLSYEVIVVDNGSKEEVRQELEHWMRQQGEGYHYIYRPMDFHFSKMCNLGAEMAKGRVLLFLNDDVEVPAECVSQSDAEGIKGLEESLAESLYQSAICSYTGAVGVKLYYPGSCRIQHAGIVNLKYGPVHKLQFKQDEGNFYYGWNRRRRNVIGVTGACLAVEKVKFQEVGGFPEELPVAFNDVDLCFSLHENGYYNVVLQDIALFHHESLSRGNDDDREKLNRLLKEKDKLYERHPGLCGADPFYHKYLAGELLSTGFELRADYEERRQNADGKLRLKKGGLADAREDACVMISMEYAGKVSESYLLQGYSFVAGSDNACFEKYLIFGQEQEEQQGKEASVWYVKAEPFIRKDVEVNLPDQVHVGMTGFCMELAAKELPQGSYRLGVLVRDMCSGQKIYAWTNRWLTVE